jgi:hypothetical protein
MYPESTTFQVLGPQRQVLVAGVEVGATNRAGVPTDRSWSVGWRE